MSSAPPIGPMLAALQQALLKPTPHCDFGRWALRIKPASAASGDFASLWMDRDGQTLLGVLGDVSGHDDPAALLALGAMGHLQQRRPRTPQQTLTTLHELVVALQSAAFMTALAFALRSDGQLELCSAGHPAAVVLQPPGSSRSLPEDSGEPLGLFADLELAPSSICTVQPCDRLLLLTDGLIERPGARAHAKMLSDTVLRRMAETGQSGRLAADADAIWSLLRAVNQRHQPAPDDQSLLLLEYSGRGGADAGMSAI